MSADDRQLAPREPEPRRVEATADDVMLSAEGYWSETHTRERIRRGKTSERVHPRRKKPNLGESEPAPEGQTVTITTHTYYAVPVDTFDASDMGAEIRRSIDQVGDPALRRMLLEELHRED